MAESKEKKEGKWLLSGRKWKILEMASSMSCLRLKESKTKWYSQVTSVFCSLEPLSKT